MPSTTKNNDLYEFLLSDTAFPEFISFWKNWNGQKKRRKWKNEEEKLVEYYLFSCNF